MGPTTSPERVLSADCTRCAGLCCVALAFAKSADFAFDKAAGEECVHLEDDFRCRIHPHLRERGFKGCTVFDCFGAGQHVTQHTFAGATWRDDEAVRKEMFAVFPIVRQLNELLLYLAEALRMPAAAPFHQALHRAKVDVEAAVDATPARILELDIEELRAPAAELLREASRRTRESVGPLPTGGVRSRLTPGADLIAADLRGADLTGAELRGALLIAADLRGAVFTRTEVIGADLRDAALHGADLAEAIYLTQVQVNAANGDGGTRLPASLSRPTYWR